MPHNLVAYLAELGQVARNTFLIYILLIAGFRFIGRRQLGQLTVIDLVIIVIMGSAVETAMVNGDVSLPAGLVSAATLLLANRLLALLATRSRRFRHLITGGPVLLVHHGHYVDEHLKRAGWTTDDVDEALRRRGFSDVADVRFALLEEDGDVNVIGKHEHTVRTAPVPSATSSTASGSGG